MVSLEEGESMDDVCQENHSSYHLLIWQWHTKSDVFVSSSPDNASLQADATHTIKESLPKWANV